VLEATDSYRDEMDSVAQFIADRCRTGDGLRGRGLYPAYAGWAKENGYRPMGARLFSQRLQQRGYAPGRLGEARYFEGIELVP
jgi:phage/plasmid-associated DNA primase